MITHCLLLSEVNPILGQGVLQSLVLIPSSHAHHALCLGSSFVIFQETFTPSGHEVVP